MDLTIHAKKVVVENNQDSRQSMITLEEIDKDLSFPAMLDFMEQELGGVDEILKLLGIDGQYMRKGVEKCPY